MKNSKRYDGLLSSFEKLAKTMASDSNIEVKMSKSGARTNGRIIYLPIRSDLLAGEDQRILHGKLDHECAHIEEEHRHNRYGRKTPLQYLADCANNHVRLFMNVFEDIRCERLKSKKYIGVAENLKALIIRAVEIHRERQEKSGESDFWLNIACAIIFSAAGYEPDWLPANYNPYIDSVRKEIEDSKKTEWASESYALALDCIDKLKKVAEKEKEEKEAKEKEKKDEGDEGEPDAEEGGDTDDDDEDDDAEEGGDTDDDDDDDDDDEEGGGDEDDGEGDDEEGDDEEGDDEDGGGDAGIDTDKSEDDERDTGTEGTSTDAEPDAVPDVEGEALYDEVALEPTTDDVFSAIDDEIKSKVEHLEATARTYYVSPIVKQLDVWKIPEKNEELFRLAKDDVSSQLRSLKSHFLRLIKAKELSSTIFDCDDGELDSDALATVPCGNKRIYYQNILGESLNTAVSILIDQSGSMGNSSHIGSRSYFAQRMAIGLAETLFAINVPFEVIGFTNDFGYPGHDYGFPGRTKRSVPGEERRNDSARSQFFWYDIFKAFDENYKVVRYRFGSINGEAENCDGEALLDVAKRLAVRPEERKILFVLSDGIPSGGEVDTSILCNHLKHTIKQVTQTGIEVMGIGAGSKHVKDYYNEYTGALNIVVDDLKDLAVVVYKGMKAMLLNKKRRG